MAWLVFMLAKATGWGEAYIWDMPYAKGLIYLHCHVLYQGCDTRWAAVMQDEAEEVDELFNRYLKR